MFINASDQEQLKYRTKNFSADIITQTKDNWSTKIEPAIKLMKDLISSRFQLTHGKLIASYNALIPIVYYNYKFDKKGIGEENNKLTIDLQTNIREWLLTSMLTGVFGGQSEGILNKAKKAIEESSKSAYFPTNEIFDVIEDLEIDVWEPFEYDENDKTARSIVCMADDLTETFK